MRLCFVSMTAASQSPEGTRLVTVLVVPPEKVPTYAFVTQSFKDLLDRKDFVAKDVWKKLRIQFQRSTTYTGKFKVLRGPW